jgi:hypothetical protein
MVPADVERGQPGEHWFQCGMNRRQSHELTLVVEGAEQGCPIGDHRRVEGDVAGDAVLARAFWVPRRDVGELDRCFHQATGLDPVLDLDVLRPVDGGDQGDVARLQTADHHDLVHRRRHNRELWILTGLMSSTKQDHLHSMPVPPRSHTPCREAGGRRRVCFDRALRDEQTRRDGDVEGIVGRSPSVSQRQAHRRAVVEMPVAGHIASGTSATRA